MAALKGVGESGSTGNEEDQLAFFDALSEGFARASWAAGLVEQDIFVGGFALRLRFAGTALRDALLPAMRHLSVGPVREPDFAIELFDSRSTGTRPPFLADRFIDLLRMRWWEYLGNRREIVELTGQRVRSVFHLGPDILSVFDSARNRAVYWVDDANGLPYYERGSPMTTLLNWWMGSRGRYLVHAAALGDGEHGMLLTNKGGSGKSTTSLACMLDGLHTAGDDYVLIDPKSREAYSLYSTIKLKTRQDVERFDGLEGVVSNLDRVSQDDDGEKAMIFAQEHLAGSLRARLPFQSILVPRIVANAEAEIVPTSAASALKALAPSTIFQLPGNAQTAFAGLVRMVRSTQCYELRLGSDIDSIPAVIRNFLAQPPRNRRSSGVVR